MIGLLHFSTQYSYSNNHQVYMVDLMQCWAKVFPIYPPWHRCIEMTCWLYWTSWLPQMKVMFDNISIAWLTVQQNWHLEFEIAANWKLKFRSDNLIRFVYSLILNVKSTMFIFIYNIFSKYFRIKYFIIIYELMFFFRCHYSSMAKQTNKQKYSKNACSKNGVCSSVLKKNLFYECMFRNCTTLMYLLAFAM